jgi:hypothetical protein
LTNINTRRKHKKKREGEETEETHRKGRQKRLQRKNIDQVGLKGAPPLLRP